MQLANKKTVFIIIGILLLLFLIRIPLSSSLTEKSDFRYWQTWSDVLVQKNGFANIYEKTWCDRSPSMLYLLWGLGKAHQIFPHLSSEIIFKLPANLCDFLITLFIFFLAKKRLGTNKAFLLSILYFLNPITFINSTFWGQMEATFTLMIILGVYFLVKEKYNLSLFILTLSFLFKPYSIVLVPIVFFWIFKEYYKNKNIKFLIEKSFCGISTIIGSVYFLHLPFVWKNILYANSFVENISAPLVLFWQRIKFAMDAYPYISVNAFNFWGIFGFTIKDNSMFIGLSYKSWGLVLFGICFLLILSLIWLSSLKNKVFVAFLTSTMLMLSTAIFLTRVHERHLCPIFALTVISMVYLSKLWRFYYWLSSIHIINLFLSFSLLSLGINLFFPSLRVAFSLIATVLTFYLFWISLDRFSVFKHLKNTLVNYYRKFS